MQGISAIRKDFLVSNLRSQIMRMQSVLNNIEDDAAADCEYVDDSLKQIEINLHQIRKACIEN